MTTDQNLMPNAKLAGFGLVVVANRFGYDSGFSQELHDRLIEGLDAAIARILMVMALERRFSPERMNSPNIRCRARTRFSGVSPSICWTS
ncbi:hypothetical protein DLJ82_5368 (plasmid) [Rhizobium leguminosarum]|uniref:Uncharacterized protein n=1 Tax=Rhizobium leguminosarum TaxID=384 RepID=A0A2Z4YPI5_RHILE|nr:hypothetical protein DLJ82_5368 [Rhizobium leguminosarum]